MATRSPAQTKALRKALTHGSVQIGKGYGRDGFTPDAIAAGTWKRLVLDKLLTPNADGSPFVGEALRVERGRIAYLTEEGREEVTQGYADEAAADPESRNPNPPEVDPRC